MSLLRARWRAGAQFREQRSVASGEQQFREQRSVASGEQQFREHRCVASGRTSVSRPRRVCANSETAIKLIEAPLDDGPAPSNRCHINSRDEVSGRLPDRARGGTCIAQCTCVGASACAISPGHLGEIWRARSPFRQLWQRRSDSCWAEPTSASFLPSPHAAAG